MRGLKAIATTFIVAYITAFGLLYLFQRQVLYRPELWERVPPSAYGLNDVTELQLLTPDGFLIYAWYVPPPAGRPVVVLFHDSDGSIQGHRFRLIRFKEAGMGVLAVSYRGYSGSEGWPTEAGLYNDARGGLDWLNAQGIRDERIVLYGESLGTGVAIRMASERDVALLILESPYTSIADAAARIFPQFPVRSLIWDRFDSLAAIGGVRAPVLVMHGSADHIVPQDEGLQIFDAANRPKEGFWPVGLGHNQVFANRGFEIAAEFIERRYRSEIAAR